METVCFEELKEENLRDVLDIYNWYVLNTTATWHYHAQSEEEIRELVFFRDDRYRTFAVRSGSVFCGYVAVHQYKVREAYGDAAEVTIYLKDGFCGKGLGTAALKHIESFARGKGLHVLIASISGDNGGSLRLFEKNGYEKCAHFREVGWKFGRVLDNVAYQKILN